MGGGRAAGWLAGCVGGAMGGVGSGMGGWSGERLDAQLHKASPLTSVPPVPVPFLRKLSWSGWGATVMAAAVVVGRWRWRQGVVWVSVERGEDALGMVGPSTNALL